MLEWVVGDLYVVVGNVYGIMAFIEQNEAYEDEVESVDDVATAIAYCLASSSQSSGRNKTRNMKYRTNQTEWMVKTWDVGQNGFTDYWPVATWSRSRRSGLTKARECLRLNRGADRIPRFTISLIRHNNISSLLLPVA